MKENNSKGIDLLDCYRIALEFGLPAAERAISLLDKETLHPLQDPLVNQTDD
ncbi:MAG: hypothetical protein ACE5GZ_01040 [Gammaproteobacteria bacterium]